MPTRPFICAILLFWTGTSGWLFYRDLWPRIRPGQPPPFTIDLADEARRQIFSTRWTVYRNDQKIGRVETYVRYRAREDLFDLVSEVPETKPLEFKFAFFQLEARKPTRFWFAVTREGILRETHVLVSLHVPSITVFGIPAGILEIRLDGEIKNGQFEPTGSVSWNGSVTTLALDPVPIQNQGSMLNPLNPVNRVSGLRRGQYWRMPLVDPMAESLRALVRQHPALSFVIKEDQGTQEVRAEVLAETQTIGYDNIPEPCLVIEYQNDRVLAHTWVRERDGLVLRQDATLGGEKLVLERE